MRIFLILTRVIAVSLLGVFVVFVFFWSGYTRLDENTVVLQTAHVPILSPHTHSAGDSAGDSAHHQYIMSPVFNAPRDLWISEIQFDIVNAPDTIVHHASLLNHNQPHQTCSSLPFSQMYIMAQDSMHLPKMTFPEGTGMRVKKGENIQLSIMVHNPLPPVGPGGTYTDVYGRLVLSLKSEEKREGLKEIKPYLLHLDDKPCVIRTFDQTDAYIFSVPPNTPTYEFAGGKSSDNPASYTFKKPSTIAYIGGHMHGWQGGKKVIVDKNNKPFLEFETALSQEYPYRYDTPYSSTKLEMQAGDTLSIRAVYENLNDVATRGAMGDLQMYFYEE